MPAMPVFRLCVLTVIVTVSAHAVAGQSVNTYQPVKLSIPAAKLRTTDPIQVDPPVISIILDDLGYRLKDGTRAVALPGKITCAFLPGSPHARKLAKIAYQQGKEIMLHLPMQADSGKEMGPVGLSENMSEQALKRTLHRELNMLPHVRGFNNHMGSYLTGLTSRMRWLMEAAMFHDDLYFVDSKTTASSVAGIEADKLGIAYTTRDIFLDYEQNSDVVAAQLSLLLKRAKKQGAAVAIGHPYPETVSVLEKWLATLKNHNVRLVPVSELIKIKNRRKSTPWRMSSSPLPKAAKSSKL
jgi:polysaccharide deacetylase 2 family uncharacterized protein YibQ